MWWNNEDNLREPELVDRSLNMEYVKHQFEMLNKLLDYNAILNKKIKNSANKKNHKLLKEIEILKEKVKDLFDKCFQNNTDGETELLENMFYGEVTKSSFHNSLNKKYFEYFVKQLENNYGKEFEVINLKSKSKKVKKEYEAMLNREITAEKHFCFKLIVPKSMSDFIKHKFVDIKESDLKKLCKSPNIFLVNGKWCNQYNEDEVFYDCLSLRHVFAHLSNTNISIDNLSNIDIKSNLYYKDDKRFLNAIFETMNLHNEDIKKQDKKQNIEILEYYHKLLDERRDTVEKMIEKL